MRPFRLIALGAAVLAGGTAHAQSKLTLRVADVYPAGHFVAETMTRPWMAEVTRRSGGSVEFQYFPAEQLGKGKDLLALTLSGVTDVGLVIPAFVSDKLPLSAVAELPGSFAKACEGTTAYWTLATDGMLADKEFQPNAVKLLFATVLPPYQIFSRAKLDSLKAFEGLKLYSTGGAKDLTVRRLKGVAVRMSTTEVYESLSRGTIDGGLMAYATARAYNLPGLVKHATIGENFGSGVITYVISQARWKQLPAALQQAMTEAGAEATRQTCGVTDKTVDSDIEKLRQAGVTLQPLPEADRKEIAALMAGVNKDWAEDLDRRGKPGTTVLQAFTEALRAAN